MAPALQTLFRVAPFSVSKTTATRRAPLRFLSTPPEKPTKERDIEKVALKKLEDAIHLLLVKVSQPTWLPFFPGGSYWAPPRSTACVFARALVTMTVEEQEDDAVASALLSLSSNRGWPSSSLFFEGSSHSPLEGEGASKRTPQSEDEEE